MSSAALFAAIVKRDEAAALNVLSKGLGKDVLNVTDAFGHTALNYACATGFSEAVVLKLIELGSNASKVNNMGTSPAMHALFHPYSGKVFEALVQAGADLRYQNSAGCTALHVACMSRTTVERIKLLIKLGADINAADKSSHTPLHTAVRCSQDYIIVDYIASICKDVNAKTENDPKHAEWTALHFAALLHSPALCATLIKRGADIDAVNWAGNTAESLCDIKTKTAMLSANNYKVNIMPYLDGKTKAPERKLGKLQNKSQAFVHQSRPSTAIKKKMPV